MERFSVTSSIRDNKCLWKDYTAKLFHWTKPAWPGCCWWQKLFSHYTDRCGTAASSTPGLYVELFHLINHISSCSLPIWLFLCYSGRLGIEVFFSLVAYERKEPTNNEIVADHVLAGGVSNFGTEDNMLFFLPPPPMVSLARLQWPGAPHGRTITEIHF